MAVTIDEMHVEVASEPAAQKNAGSAPEEPKKKVDLHRALEMMHERKYRLKAD